MLDTAATALHLVLLDFDGKCEINFAFSLHERDDTHNWPQGLNDWVGVNGDRVLPLNGARGDTVTAADIYVLSRTNRPRGRSGATTRFRDLRLLCELLATHTPRTHTHTYAQHTHTDTRPRVAPKVIRFRLERVYPLSRCTRRRLSNRSSLSCAAAESLVTTTMTTSMTAAQGLVQPPQQTSVITTDVRLTTRAEPAPMQGRQVHAVSTVCLFRGAR